MRKMIDGCLSCESFYGCYYNDFQRCPKIEKAGIGLGIPVKPKDDSWIRNMPFSVYMALKHLVFKSKQISRSPNICTTPEIPQIEYSRVEFANKLAMETAMSHNHASVFVAEISLYGNIKDAIEVYNKQGLMALGLYLAGLKAKMKGLI